MNELTGYYELADALIKRLSRLVYGDKCIVCHRTVWDIGALDPGHFIDRRAKSVKWDIYNVFPQCRICNTIHEKNKEPMTRAVREILGPKRMEELIIRSKEIFYPSVTAMKEIINDLREAIRAVEEQRRRIFGV